MVEVLSQQYPPFPFDSKSLPPTKIGASILDDDKAVDPKKMGGYETGTCDQPIEKMVWVVVSNIFYFHPYLRKIPILTNIFQMG